MTTVADQRASRQRYLLRQEITLLTADNKALTAERDGVLKGSLLTLSRAEKAEAKLAKVEADRAEQWRLRREAEASREAASAACDSMRIERDAVALATQTPQQQFAHWLETGPKLAKAAGLYVRIKVTDAPIATSKEPKK